MSTEIDTRDDGVGLLGNVLIASADTMKELLDAVAAKNIEGSPLVHKVV